MPSICHVQVLPHLTGAQRSMLELFEHLDRGRFRLHVVCQRPGAMTERLERMGVRCHYVPSLVRPVHPLRDALAARELSRLFRRQRFDLVHTHSTKPGLLARWAAAQAGVGAIVHHVRGFACHERSSVAWRWVCGRLERWAGRFSHRVVFVNHEERRQAVEAGWLPAGKCRTIYNGADLAALAPWHHGATRLSFRAQHGLARDDVALVTLMRLDWQKQPWIVPEIADHLRRMKTTRPWRWLVFGAGRCAESLAARLRVLGLAPQVQFAGWLDDPRPAYHGADLVVHPSLWEGLPRTLIEAQAAGRVCVASDVKGNREVVAPGTGELCAPRDAVAFARSLAGLINEPQRVQAFGQAARLRAEREFDAVRHAEEIAALYDELLETRCSPAPARSYALEPAA